MNISEALIEKYHQGLCSPEEAEAVEKWLDSGEEQEYEFPAEVSINEIKAEVWNQVNPYAPVKARPVRPLVWKYAGMAAAAVVLIVGICYLPMNQKDHKLAVHKVSAPRQREALKIELGTESGAVYSQENRMLDFCGIVKITPRENMKLSFTSLCDGNRETVKEIDIKGGNTYFAMDLKHQNSSELLITDKNLVGELPPLLQNSLIAQFGI